MARLEHLDSPSWGTWVIRSIGVVTGAILGLVCVALAATAPLLLILAAPLLALVAWVTIRLWRVGVYESEVGIVVRGVLRSRVLPWNLALHARVDEVRIGFRPESAVVLASRNGTETELFLWNERSWLMLGRRDGVQALAVRINAAIELHQR
jgi:hypothetical protein